MNKTDISFLCPSCGNSLTSNEMNIICRKCNKEILTESGVVELSEGKTYWEIVPKDQMARFLTKAAEVGWVEAINSSDCPEIRELYLWTNAPSRTDGSYYLPLTKESIVLDLGSGWGSYTFPLSKRTKLVVAADSCAESLKFISLRAGQDMIENVLPVHIRPLDTGPLPFESGQFDCVIMNGVLEWIGSYLKNGDPKKIQENCLKDVFRILRPGGTLYVGIENRYGYKYFLGAPDDHLAYYSQNQDVSYTTILPRFVADIICRYKLGTPYRTYTHSLPALKKMFAKAGFAKTDFYYPENGYRALSSKVTPLKSHDVNSLMNKRYGKNFLFRVFSKFFGAAYFCDSYFAIAKKEN